MEAICTIVVTKKYKNENDFLVKDEIKNKGYVDIKKVWEDEFYKSQQIGIRPTLKLKMRQCDLYKNVENEYEIDYILVNGRKYEIIRVYLVDSEWAEVSVKDK